MNELNQQLPEKYIWITLMEPTLAGKPLVFEDPAHPLLAQASATSTAPKNRVIDGLHIRGLYLYNTDERDRVVSQFVANLAKSSLFNLNVANERSIIVRRDPQNEREWAFAYELQLTLRHPLRLH